jgi:hypothetical protein
VFFFFLALILFTNEFFTPSLFSPLAFLADFFALFFAGFLADFFADFFAVVNSLSINK